MPDRVQNEADAMCGTMTALGQSARPGFIAGSSSNTSRPHLRARERRRNHALALPSSQQGAAKLGWDQKHLGRSGPCRGVEANANP